MEGIVWWKIAEYKRKPRTLKRTPRQRIKGKKKDVFLSLRRETG